MASLLSRTLSGLWLALCLLWSSTPAYAAPPFGANQCPAERFGSDLGCTANDVSITGMQVVGGSASCTGGSSITVDLDVTVNFATPDRWDVGIFLSNDGKDPGKLIANGGAASCTVSVLPNTAPFLNLDPGPDSKGVTDTCGDGNSTIGGGSGSGVLRVSGVTVPCQSRLASGKLYIPFVVSWDNQKTPAGGTCTSNLDPVPNTKSKCNAPLIDQASVAVVVLPSITKSNVVTRITPGDTTTYTITVSNTTGVALDTASANAVVFKDPAVANLVVSGVTCAAAGGATCPTAGALTVAAMQGAGVTIPSMPSGSTVVFTVTAQLTGNPTGTLVNTATVTSNGQTNSASDSDAIVYPNLTTQKTITTVSDPVNGTANPKNIPGAEVLYSIKVSNTGPGTVNTDVLAITDAVPAHLEFYAGDIGLVGSGPIRFTDGSPTSNLTYSFTSLSSAVDGVAFSSDGGVTFGYTPVPGGTGYDPAVTHIRLFPKGKMAAWSGSGNYPSFTFDFKARIK
jgi:uncharacterized repeat protein (TIGR01451 family)